MAKKEAMMGVAMVFVIVVFGGVGALYAASVLGIIPSGGGSVVSGGGSGSGAPVINIQQQCGSTGTGTINFRSKIDGNLTSTEWSNDVLYVYQKNTDGTTGQQIGTITSGATSTYVTLASVACGQKLVGYVLSATGTGVNEGGTTANVVSVDSAADVSRNADGGIEINMDTQNVYITAHKAGNRALLQFKAFDVDNNGYLYNATYSSATSWVGANATYTSTTNNMTNMTVANNGMYTERLYVSAVESDGVYNADTSGVLLAVNADVGTWASVSVSGNGFTSTPMSLLTAQEQVAYNSNEFFFVTQDPLANTPPAQLTITLKAQPSVSTWKCPVLTFASRGDYLGTTTGNMVLHSANKDDSSKTSVYPVQTVMFMTSATGCAASS